MKNIIMISAMSLGLLYNTAFADSISPVDASQVKNSVVQGCAGWQYHNQGYPSLIPAIKQLVADIPNIPDKYKQGDDQTNLATTIANNLVDICTRKTWKEVTDSAVGLNVSSENVAYACHIELVKEPTLLMALAFIYPDAFPAFKATYDKFSVVGYYVHEDNPSTSFAWGIGAGIVRDEGAGLSPTVIGMQGCPACYNEDAMTTKQCRTSGTRGAS